MALVTISGGTGDAGALGDDRPWLMWAAAYQPDGQGGVITTRDDRASNVLRPVGGTLTFKVEAGIAFYLENPDKRQYLVTAPETDATLWATIEASVAFPPDTDLSLLTAAVAQSVVDNADALTVDTIQASTDGLSAEFLRQGDVLGSVELPSAALESTVTTGADGQDIAVNDGFLTAKNPLYIDPTQAPYFVKADRKTFTTAAMSSSVNPTHLTVTGYTFTSADIGKHVKVVGAAAAGANLKTTIVGVSSGKAVLDDACATTVSNVFCIFGTDNATALQALFDDISHTGAGLGYTAVFGAGAIMFSGTLYLPYAATVKGASENWGGQDVFWGRSTASEARQSTCFYQMWDSDADAFRVQQALPNQDDWVGKYAGFLIITDLDNTSGSGLSFKNSDGDPVSVIDGGTIERINVSGAPGAGFDFAGGVVGNAVIRDLAAWGCGYMDRKLFTADTTNGSTTLSNVSSFTGLAVGDILSGPGIPVDSVIMSLNSGAGTLVMRIAATATAAGINVQRAGSPGIRYKCYGNETVHLDGPSGDQNSGGLLRVVGVGSTPAVSMVVTNIKNEFGVNAYRESYNNVGSFPSIPQGSNMVVTDNAASVVIDVRGFSHWANATSSIGGATPNTLGRDIGAAFLDLPTGSSAPDITFSAGNIRLAAGSGQTEKVVLRDSYSSNTLPITTVSKGTNRVSPRNLRLVADANTILSVHDSSVGWSTLTAARTGMMPLGSLLPTGAERILIDVSGSASTSLTITAIPFTASGNTIVGDTAITTPYGHLQLTWDGTRWIGRASQIQTKSVVSLTTTATLAAVPGHEYIYLLGSGAVPTIPTAVGNLSKYHLKNKHTAAISVAATSSQTFDGMAGPLILQPNDCYTLVSDNANWWII